MSKLFNVFAAILLIVGSCFVVSDSHAKVCFLGEDCGSGGNFSDGNKVKPEDMCKALICIYITKESCDAAGKYMPEYCPLSNKMGICCGKDYFHETCAYPLVSAGMCGSKYKCQCDQDAYQYTINECKYIDSPEGKNAAIVGGASCAEEVLKSSGDGFDINTYYTECRCDRALYPYTPDMCDENTTVPPDGICTSIDANGNKSKFYASCYCDRKTFQYTSADCFPYVGDEGSPKCSSGGAMYYSSCKSCEGYPARNLDHVGYKNNKPAVDAYDVCPYAQTTGYYKILRCDDPGYRVSTGRDPKPGGGYYEAGRLVFQ